MASKVERPLVGGGRKPAPARLLRVLKGEAFFRGVLAMPMQLLLWFLLIIPTLIVLYLSLVAWEPRMGTDWWQAPFSWFRNYGHVISDVRFWQAIVRTICVVAVAVMLEFTIGLGLALFFQRDFLGKRLFTSVILYPMMLPWVVVGLAFYLLFLEKGPVNYILIHFLGFKAGVAWYHYPVLALSTIILADVWQWTPFMFLILYSGLGALPRDPVEAAMTLGASRWQIFRYITMPMLKQVVIIALIIRSLEAFKIFDLVFIMTGGGPGTATESISLYIYRLGFVYGQLSYAAAMAVLILISISIITRLAVRPLEYEV